MGNARAQVVVEGRVQGVFFRGSVRDEAARRGVRGWVRNRADGSVEAVLEGAPDAVEQVVAFMRHGPPGARVVDAQVSYLEAKGEFSGFAIRT